MSNQAASTIVRKVTNIETVKGAPNGTTGITMEVPAIRDGKLVPGAVNRRCFIASKDGRKWTATASGQGMTVVASSTGLKKLCDILEAQVNAELAKDDLDAASAAKLDAERERTAGSMFPRVEGTLTIAEEDKGALEAVLAKHSRTKLQAEDIVSIRERVEAGESMSSIAKELGMSSTGVRNIVLGNTWKHVGGPIRPGGGARRALSFADKITKAQVKIAKLQEDIAVWAELAAKAEEEG